ncbi:hypothetical protein DEJ50_20870 [Streptomyces venezuelae]|uniref:Secreted protein n=1 Tax=Streptomyces venezuelae TaxID=54571 RepID=A0A5P2D9U2_STRVZ|nr:hypothetical protein [Streptomyces venezuelae]QES49909.1 hypothetical protein DEJ50_20870 [Streptomyces venezuelae]
MKRTRIAALALATAAAALAPALVEASAADGTSFLQDPAGGEQEMRSAKDGKYKVEGQLRFHPGVVYSMVPRPAAKGQQDWGGGTDRKVPDPKSLAWEPKFEFAWGVSEVALLKKALASKGRHPVVLHATLWTADRTKAAEVHSSVKERPATGRTTLPGGKRIACDTGGYTVDWSVTRTGHGSVGGTLKWNADCAQYRTAFSQN